MAPKEGPQVAHLVVVRNALGQYLEVIDAYTTEVVAKGAVQQLNHRGLEIISVEVKTKFEAPKRNTKVKAIPAKKISKHIKDEESNDEETEQVSDEKRKRAAGGSLDGLKLIFTGYSPMDRKTCEASAIKHGAVIVPSMKQADYVVLGPTVAMKKWQEIEREGCTCMHRIEFNEMIKSQHGDNKKAKRNGTAVVPS